jgi:hypothetical protein
MIVKMKRDYAISYKYAWLLKGNIYDSTKLPKEVKDKIPDLVKRGIAVEMADKSVKGQGVSENYRVKQLEQKKIEDAQSKDDAENRSEQAQASNIIKPAEVKKPRTSKKKEVTIEVVAPIVEEEIIEEEVEEKVEEIITEERV